MIISRRIIIVRLTVTTIYYLIELGVVIVGDLSAMHAYVILLV